MTAFGVGRRRSGGVSVQRRVRLRKPEPPREAVDDAVALGVDSPSTALPFVDRIQAAFGHHDVGRIRAHTGPRAEESAGRLGAEAYATGDDVVLGTNPDLRTVAHEAAHVVQQRSGVSFAGLGPVDDHYERHAEAVANRVAAGESAESLFDGAGSEAPGETTPGAVQRVVALGSALVAQGSREDVRAQCEDWAKKKGDDWKNVHDQQLQAHFDAREILHAKDIGDLAGKVLAEVDRGERPALKRLADNDLDEARKRRHIERLSRATEPFAPGEQVADHVEGVNEVPSDQLLPLDHRRGEAQEMRWLEDHHGKRSQVKKRGTSEAETHVAAFGDPHDPSMTYFHEDRQLGHRYKGIPNDRYADNHADNRTYGGKIPIVDGKPHGTAVKVEGAVDGHSIQAQNDQKTLGPDAARYPSADRHPHNMYWENPAYGKFVRQNMIENPAFQEETNFLHVNEYSNYDNPTTVKDRKGGDQIVADVVHDLVQTDASEPDTSQWDHVAFDNNIFADYEKLNKEDGSYPHRKRLTKKKGGMTLGKDSSKDHYDANKRSDTSGFPRAAVVNTTETGFRFEPPWRHTAEGYESPPASPYYAPQYLESETEVLPGRRYEGESLGEGWVVVEANYDRAKNETTVTKSRPKPLD